jgi:hypothetical protein
MSLPDAQTAYDLLRNSAGPSPWRCNAPIPSALGLLTWKALDLPHGANALIDLKAQPRLALPMYVWFQVLDTAQMLLWKRIYTSERMAAPPIRIQLLDLDHFRPLNLNMWSTIEARSVDPYFEIAPEFCACSEISSAFSPGVHSLSLPPAFDRVPEFFIVGENPGLSKAQGGASTCVYAVDPSSRRIEVLPQKWFNEGKLDYGYQWIACATRDPASRRLIVGGFRIDNYILDETGTQVEQRLPR